MQAGDLIGAWRLKSWKIVYGPHRSPTFPFGADAEGLLLYSADGWMSAAMWVRQRTEWSATSARQASVISKATAADELLTYAGRWTVRGEAVQHEIVASLNPSLLGTIQVRQATIAAASLSLAADEADADGARRRHVIDWVRPLK